VNVSYPKVENVVYAPRNPTATAVLVTVGQRATAGPVRTNARRNEPEMLTPNVAHGNVRTPTASPMR